MKVILIHLKFFQQQLLNYFSYKNRKFSCGINSMCRKIEKEFQHFLYVAPA